MKKENDTAVFKLYYSLKEAAQQCHVLPAKLRDISRTHNITPSMRGEIMYFSAGQVTDLKMLADLYDRSKADLVALIVKEVYPRTYKNIA